MKNRRGFVLPTVIFAITIMSLVVVAALTTASDERRASRASREATLAMYAADAGLRQTYGAWPSAAVQTLNPGDSLDLGWANLPNRAAYRAVIYRVDPGGLQEYNVVVQGRRTDPTAGVMTIVGAVGGVATFKYAVRSEAATYFTNGGVVDAYDSNKGAYVATSIDSAANVRTGGDFNIDHTTIKGDVTVTGTPTVGLGTVMTGGMTTGAPAPTPMDIPSCPGGGYTASAKVPTGPGISYNALSGLLTVNGPANLTLTDSVYFFRAIVLTNNGKITVPGSPKATIFLADSINAGAGSIVNQSQKPANLSLSSCGTSATPAWWSLASGASAGYYTVYAPNHIVYETGGGDYYGAVVAQIYYSSGGGKFHYDEALLRQPSQKIVAQRGGWAQLPGG
jgi:hypothetical protein